MDTLLWAVIVFIAIFLLFVVVYALLAFDELIHDHKNPSDVCRNINPWVLPEYGAHALIVVLLLVTGNWVPFVFSAPLLFYHIHRYMNRPRMSRAGIYDEGEIFNREQMKKCQRELYSKLAYYLVLFFLFLYNLMYSLLGVNDQKHVVDEY